MINSIIRLKRTKSTDKKFGYLISYLNNELNNRHNNQRSVYDKYNKVDSIQTVIIAFVKEKPIGCECFKWYDDNTIEKTTELSLSSPQPLGGMEIQQR